MSRDPTVFGKNKCQHKRIAKQITMRMRRVFVVLSTIFFGVVLGIFASEVAIRWIAPQPISGSWLYVNSSGLVMNKSQGRAAHTIGNRTVYYAFEYPGIRKTGTFDAEKKVLVLGDSFTFGWGLKDEETFVQLLENRAREEGYRVRFLNAATGGWGLDSYLRYLEEYVDVVNPCLTLLFLNTDDIGRAWKNRLYVYDGHKIIQNSRKATSSVKRILQKIPFYDHVIENSQVVQLLRQTYLLLLSGSRSSGAGSLVAAEGPSSPDVDDIRGAVTLGIALMEEIAKTAEKHGSDIVVLTTGWHRPPYDDTEPTRAFMLQAARVLSEKKIKYRDLSPLVQSKLRAIGAEARIPLDQHPSAKAAAIIAEVAWPELAMSLAGSRCGVTE